MFKQKKKLIILCIVAAVILAGLGFLLRNIGAGKSQKHPVTIASVLDFNSYLGSGGSALTGKENPGTYYFKLLGNLRLSQTGIIDNGHTVVIDLNGHKLTGKDDAPVQAFRVTEGASLTLTDGTLEMAGADANGGLLSVFGAGCSLTLEDVHATNTDDSRIGENLTGGILYVFSPNDEPPATVTLKGDTVLTGTDSGLRRGGGVLSAKGSAEVRMYGGTIQNGQAQCSGNVQLADTSKFYMHDGTITGGTAVGSSAISGMGGNVDIRQQARFYLYGGAVTDGTAGRTGGNIFLSCYGKEAEDIGLHLYGGTIENGSAKNGGGNIFATEKESVVRIYGGKIQYGQASYGGNIYLEGAGFLMRGGSMAGTQSGNCDFGGNIYARGGILNLYDGFITGGMSSTNGGNICLEDSNMDIYGGTIFAGATASTDVGTGGGNIYAGGTTQLNMYGGEISFGTSNLSQVPEVSCAGGNVFIANKSFFQLFGGEISNGMVYGKVSRGGSVYVYGQPAGSSCLFHMYGGTVKNNVLSGTMRGLSIAAYSETGGTSGNGIARVFGGSVLFAGSSTHSQRYYTVYGNHPANMHIIDETAYSGPMRGGARRPCGDPTHETFVESAEVTCTTPAYTKYTCGTCGDWYKVAATPAGHWDLVGEPVALDGQEGWVKFTCQHCGQWYRNPNDYTETEKKETDVVPAPLAYPDYTFTETPGTMQMRLTAVRAMQDLLSIQWCSPEGIGYNKAGSKKFFEYPRGLTFGGVMYTGASAGLFHFLEYYDYDTGRFVYPGPVDEMKMKVGSACTDSLLWSWSTVCTSVSCAYFPSALVPANGFIPVGSYTFDDSIKSYYQLSTAKIVEDNGLQTMAWSYAKMQPADILVSSTADHGLMVLESPYVLANPDGSINTSASYVMIQDQRGGVGAGFYDVEHDGYTVCHSGRISQKFTFDELFAGHYIPVTAPEFIGEKEYEQPTVTVEGGSYSSLADLSRLTVSSNYPLAVININATDKSGKVTNVEKILFNGLEETGVPRSYALADSQALKEADASWSKLEIEVVTSTGKRFIPIELDLAS